MVEQARPPTVLIVDDDDLVRTVMALELEDGACKVLTASCGTQAIEVLKAHPVDVAVIDLNMPTLGGMALMTIIQADWPKLSIVATSGAEPREPMPEGVIFIPKPHTPGQLVAAVEVSLLTEEFGLR